MSPPINILLLIELVAIVIASSAFLFYLNRLGGSVLAFIIRFFIWRKHHVWVTIGSLQISLLAGRITFRGDSSSHQRRGYANDGYDQDGETKYCF